MNSVKSLASMLASDEPEDQDSEMSMDGEGEEMDGESVAAEELMYALEAKDTEAFKSALKSFISMCQE